METDHKPLIPLLSSKSLDSLTPRLQSFRIRLMRFRFDISYTPGKELLSADLLSRQPCSSLQQEPEPDWSAAYVHAISSSIPASDEKLAAIWEAQQEDVVSRLLSSYVTKGWPDKKRLPPSCAPYWTHRHEISIVDGLVNKNGRILIPAPLRREILNRLHEGHQGITKCRRRAAESVWWPGLSREIEDSVTTCLECIQERSPRAEPMLGTPLPERPWQEIAMDIFHHSGNNYLVLVDYYSRYPEVFQLENMSSTHIIQHCKSAFARHGIPELVRTDNGPQFRTLDVSAFSVFATSYGFRHITSSPHYPQSNGMAESAVKVVKNLIKKSSDVFFALLSYSSTALENGLSPAQMLMGRRLRTPLPVLPDLLKAQAPDELTLRRRERELRSRKKTAYDAHHGVHQAVPLRVVDRGWVTDIRSEGIISRNLPEPRSYLVQTPTGSFRRNRRHIIASPRPASEEMNPSQPAKDALPQKRDVDLGTTTGLQPDAAPPPQEPEGGGVPQQQLPQPLYTTTRAGRVVRPPERLDL